MHVRTRRHGEFSSGKRSGALFSSAEFPDGCQGRRVQIWALLHGAGPPSLTESCATLHPLSIEPVAALKCACVRAREWASHELLITATVGNQRP